MKKITPAILLALLLISCGGKEKSIDEILETRDTKVIQAKKEELTAQLQDISSSLKRIDDTLKVLNPDRNIPLVTEFVTSREKFNHYVEFQGSVETKENLVISPEVSGILERVLVKEGARVKKGQLLAKIDDNGLAQQLAQLRIQADLAKTTYQRQKRLWDQNIGSEIEYLNTKSSFESLQESVNQVEKQLSKTSIRAPFNGTIDDIITEQGNVVSAGATPILRIINLSNMYISVDVPETFLTSIVPGKSVEIYLPVLGRTVESTVRQTGSFINRSNRTFNVEIAVPNSDKIIKPNITARVKINDYISEGAILIPQSIISENAQGEQYVYAIVEGENNNSEVEQTIIKTGKTQGDMIEVLEGLDSSMRLVKEGARSVKNGQVVRVVSER